MINLETLGLNVLIPFQSLNRNFKDELKGKIIFSESGEEIGKVMASKFNCGVAIIDKEKLETVVNPKFNINGLNTVFYDPVSLYESIRELNTREEVDEKDFQQKQIPPPYKI